MGPAPERSVDGIADDLFDKYTLPKVALGVILAASLVGTGLSVRLSGQRLLVGTLVKWAYFLALGVLTGGLVWKHVFVRPQDLGTDAREYCARMYARFDRIALGALVVLGASSVGVFAQYSRQLGTTDTVLVFGGVVAAFGGAILLERYHSPTVTEEFRHPLGLVALMLAMTLVVVTAVAEVTVGGGGVFSVAVRILHLLAFALWLGGAVWNIFVAVPTGKATPTMAVVEAAGQQLERFRWAVRLIIPTLFVTGVYQAVAALGAQAGPYLSTVLGQVVLLKVAFIGVLVVIFKLCPMWRACSPIDGVCDLDTVGDAEPTPEEGSSDA